MDNLTQEQERAIEDYFRRFELQELEKELQKRHEFAKFVQKILSEQYLDNLSEIEFGDLISKLWASQVFVNKEFAVQRILKHESIENIRHKFKQLLYGAGDFAERFDSFEIKGIGPASITEILCYFNPNEFGIWNSKSIKGLKRLGFNQLPLEKYKISGEEYQQINRVLKLIAQKLGSLGFQTDLLGVDYFLYLVQQQEISQKELKEEIQRKALEFEHDDIVYLIADIGKLLGFDVYDGYLVAPGAKLDVLWAAKIANIEKMGYIGYAFEVQKSGSLDSLILNLQKALSVPSIQIREQQKVKAVKIVKGVAVSDAQQLQELEKETQALPENFRKSLVLWEVNEVIEAHQKLSETMKMISKLGIALPSEK